MRKLILTLMCLGQFASNGAQAATLFDGHNAWTIQYKAKDGRLIAEDVPPDPTIHIPEGQPIYIVLPPTSWHHKRSIGSRLADGARAMGRGVKNVAAACGRKIVQINKKIRPAVDVIDTGTVIGGALYFWSKAFSH